MTLLPAKTPTRKGYSVAHITQNEDKAAYGSSGKSQLTNVQF